MKKFNLLFVIFSLVIMTSCSEDDEVITDQIVTNEDSTILFTENFESSPTSNSFRHRTGELIEGINRCGFYSISNAVALNSIEVNLRNDQNSSNFLGVNPQNPCGGVTDGRAKNEVDLSGALGSLQLKFDYIITNSLWESPNLNIKFTNLEGEEYVIESELTERDSWTSVTFDLPEIMKSTTVEIYISSENTGEAVGIDNIEIIDVI